MQEEERSTGDIVPTKEDAEQEATSKETVSDLEKSGESSTGESGTGDENSESSSAPSPDGQLDEPHRQTGPGDETGPM